MSRAPAGTAAAAPGIGTCSLPRREEITLGIVCPMANEAETAAAFVRLVLQQCAEVKSAVFFAVLDRASQDQTREILSAYAAGEPRLIVVWAPENRCAVDAYLRGYREALAAGVDYILEIDAGFSHHPDDIPQYFDALEEGYDCVFGSRFMRGSRVSEEPLQRYLISRGGTLLANVLLGTHQTDMTSGFELFSRRALVYILERGIHSRAHFFQTEIKVHARHLRYKEVPIGYRAPSPRMNRSSLADAFRNLWRLFLLRLKGKL